MRSINTSYLNKNYKRELTYEYKEDNTDNFLKKRNKNKEKVIGSYEISLGDKFASGSQAKTNSYFAYSHFYEDERIAVSNPVTIPRLWKEYTFYPDREVDFEPRIFTYSYAPQVLDNVTSSAWRWREFEITALPFLTMNDPNRDLNYGTENGLAATYWRQTTGTIADARILTVSLYLTPKQVSQFNLTQQIYLDHHEIKGCFYVNRIIDYQPNKTQVTKLELIPVVNGYTFSAAFESLIQREEHSSLLELAQNSIIR